MVIRIKNYSTSFHGLILLVLIWSEAKGFPAASDALVEDDILETQLLQPSNTLSAIKLPQSRLLVSGGPSNVCPSVYEAIKQQVGMYEDATRSLMDGAVEGIRYAFQTRNNWTFPLVGTGTYATTTMLLNLLEPGDTLLVGIYGYWGERVVEIARKIPGVKVATMVKGAGEIFSLQELTAAVIKHKPNVLFLVHGETSTGVVLDMEGVGDLCQKYNCLLVLDVAGTIAGVPVHIDKWKVDAAYSNTQKGFCSIVGLAPITVSQRAVNRIQRRTTAIATDVLDLKQLAELWSVPGRPGLQPSGALYFSTPISQLFAIRESCTLLARETLEFRWAKTRRLMGRLIQRLGPLGIKPFVKNPNLRLHTTTTFVLPPGINVHDLQDFATKNYKVDLGDGYYDSAAATLRISLFGPNLSDRTVETVVGVVRTYLNRRTG